MAANVAPRPFRSNLDALPELIGDTIGPTISNLGTESQALLVIVGESTQVVRIKNSCWLSSMYSMFKGRSSDCQKCCDGAVVGIAENIVKTSADLV